MKKHIIIIFGLFFLSFSARSQNIFLGADSLNKMAFELQKSDLNLSLKYAKTAFRLATMKKDSVGIADGLLNIGMVHYYTNHFDSALTYIRHSYSIFTTLNDSSGIAYSAVDLAMVYQQINKVQLAEKYYLIGLEMSRAMKNEDGVSAALNNLGQLYQTQEDNQRALQMYMLSAAIDKKAGNEYGVAQTWINIAGVYSEWEKYELGNLYYRKAIDYFSARNDSRNQAIALVGIGDNYRLNQQFDQAHDYLKKAIALSRKNSDVNELITGYIYYSKWLLDVNKSDSADFYLFEAMNMCVETGNMAQACDALHQRGISLAQQKKYAESNQFLLNAYEFALSMNYQSALKAILLLLSENYGALGQYNEAWKYQKMASAYNGIDEPAIPAKKPAEPSQHQNQTNLNSVLYAVLSGIILILILVIIQLSNKLKKQKHPDKA